MALSSENASRTSLLYLINVNLFWINITCIQPSYPRYMDSLRFFEVP